MNISLSQGGNSMPNLRDIEQKLSLLKQQGFIKSLRRGPTGIGHTFEQSLGLLESNLQLPDLGGRVELKATRRTSASLITLFTFNRNVWIVKPKELIQNFGYVDTNGRKALYSTVWANAVNAQGFTLEINSEAQSLILKHNEQVAIWSLYRLVGALLYKLGKVLYIIADSRIGEDGIEEFHFNEAYLLEDPNTENFISAFQNSRACIDVRMHLKPDGSVRNHGTGFRIRESELDIIFAHKRKIL